MSNTKNKVKFDIEIKGFENVLKDWLYDLANIYECPFHYEQDKMNSALNYYGINEIELPPLIYSIHSPYLRNTTMDKYSLEEKPILLGDLLNNHIKGVHFRLARVCNCEVNSGDGQGDIYFHIEDDLKIIVYQILLDNFELNSSYDSYFNIPSFLNRRSQDYLVIPTRIVYGESNKKYFDSIMNFYHLSQGVNLTSISAKLTFDIR